MNIKVENSTHLFSVNGLINRCIQLFGNLDVTIAVFLYDDHTEFYKRFGDIPEWVIAACTDDEVHFKHPKLWDNSVDTTVEQIILHECAHICTYHRFGKIPVWINEGIAMMAARQLSSTAREIQLAYRDPYTLTYRDCVYDYADYIFSCYLNKFAEEQMICCINQGISHTNGFYSIKNIRKLCSWG